MALPIINNNTNNKVACLGLDKNSSGELKKEKSWSLAKKVGVVALAVLALAGLTAVTVVFPITPFILAGLFVVAAIVRNRIYKDS